MRTTRLLQAVLMAFGLLCGTGTLADEPTAQAAPEHEMLVGGAPLSDPNVRVHIVQRKQFGDQGRFELVAFPVIAQINPRYTQHFGSALSLVYHPQENFVFQLTPIYNWYAQSSDFNRELNNSISKEGNAPNSLLLSYGALWAWRSRRSMENSPSTTVCSPIFRWCSTVAPAWRAPSTSSTKVTSLVPPPTETPDTSSFSEWGEAFASRSRTGSPCVWRSGT